VQVSMSGYRR